MMIRALTPKQTAKGGNDENHFFSCETQEEKTMMKMVLVHAIQKLLRSSWPGDS
jgi:hypothetical protein